MTKFHSKIMSYVLMMTLALTACTQSDFQDEPATLSPQSVDEIDLEEAIDIANHYLGSNSRSNSFDVEYFTSTRNSRSSIDTLAYILNRVDNDGFAIISRKRISFPMLAYSDKTGFDYDSESEHPVNSAFLDNLDYYLATIGTLPPGPGGPSFPPIEMTRTPIVEADWNQWHPFNTYVVAEHPNCPVGCTAVAIATAMVYGKESVSYHNISFPLGEIRQAMADSIGIAGHTSDNPNAMTYSVAVDYAAQLLYWIGADCDMNYSPTGSGAQSAKGINLLSNLGYTIPTDYLVGHNLYREQPYNVTEISNYLAAQNYIIYIEGFRHTDTNDFVGHAWIIDGSTIIWQTIGNQTLGCKYFHCEWGWGGTSDGYYAADVMDTNLTPSIRYNEILGYAAIQMD